MSSVVSASALTDAWPHYAMEFLSAAFLTCSFSHAVHCLCSRWHLACPVSALMSPPVYTLCDTVSESPYSSAWNI